MSTYGAFVVFVIGLLMIIKGGDIFLNGAIGVAKITGISTGIIGATIVSIATTLPELLVSTIAAYEGLEDMCIGNAIGTYISNIAFIIGISSIIKPIKIDGNFNIKGIMMISFLILFYILAMDGMITKKEGAILFSLVIFFLWANAAEHKRDDTKRNKLYLDKEEISKNIVFFIVGGLLVVTGSHLLLDSAVQIANFLHIPQNVISLTFLAIGTALPELVTAITAIRKKEQSISVGNILGANIYNLTMILGLSALFSDNGITIYRQTLTLDFSMAMIVTLLFVGSGIFRKKISRQMGFLLLFIYLVFIFALF
jgi:cation:H+ antiporter